MLLNVYSRINSSPVPFVIAPQFPFRVSPSPGSLYISGCGLDALNQSSTFHAPGKSLACDLTQLGDSRDSCLLLWGRKTTFLTGIKEKNMKLHSLLEKKPKATQATNLRMEHVWERAEEWLEQSVSSLCFLEPLGQPTWKHSRVLEFQLGIPFKSPDIAGYIYGGKKTNSMCVHAHALLNGDPGEQNGCEV